MDEEYKQSEISKEVQRLMDEEGYEFGEAVKEAMAQGYKDGGLMVAIQKFNQGGRAYDSRATVEDMAKAIQTSSAGNNSQKLQMLMDYDNAYRQSQNLGNFNQANLNPQKFTGSNQVAMEKLLGIQPIANFSYNNPYPQMPMMLMPMMPPPKDPGYFGNQGFVINGKRYRSEDEAIEDMGIETYNRFMAKGGMAGGKTYHQYHDQYVPRDEESMGYANGGGVGSMMVPKKKKYQDQRLTAAEKKKIKPANQGGGPNYLGKQETVTVPKKWLSDPDHVVAELAYITPREQKILLDENIYGSLKGKPNKGPGGIMSLQGDLGGYDASPGGPNSGDRSDRGKTRAADIMTGRVNVTSPTGRTVGYKGPSPTGQNKYGDFVGPTSRQGLFSNFNPLPALIGFINPIAGLLAKGIIGAKGKLGDLFGDFAGTMRGIDPLTGKPNTQKQYELNQLNQRNVNRLDNLYDRKFSNKSYSQKNIDMLEAMGVSPSKGNIKSAIDRDLQINPETPQFARSYLQSVAKNLPDQKPTANITATNLNDFEIGNPGKYATADALTEANMADYQTSLVDEFAPYGIDRTNLYEDFVDNRDLISETATSPQFDTSLINEFGVKDRGIFDANQGLQYGSIPGTSNQGFVSAYGTPDDQFANPQPFGTSNQGFGLMNSDAAKAAAMSVMSNAFNQNVNPATSDMGFPNRNMDFPDQGELTASLPGNNLFAEITQKDIDRFKQPMTQMMDYDTYKSINTDSTLTPDEFNQLKARV
jgi:hypothetical protein